MDYNPKQILDWSAAWVSGLLASTIFFLLAIFLAPYFDGGNAWTVVRTIAAPILGEQVLAPPASFHATALVVSIFLVVGVSTLLTVFLAGVIHRFGMIVGLVGGGLFGLGYFSVVFYLLTIVFPWLFALKGDGMLIAFISFGCLAGGLYEALEVETGEMEIASSGESSSAA